MARIGKRPMSTVIVGCSWHLRDQLTYIQAAEYAEERMARGEKQTQCLDCKLWLWPHEMGRDA